ncbi:GNAT family N-acetyltransferase [Spirosoma arcticum]
MNLQYQPHNGLPTGALLTSLLDLLITVFNNQSRDELIADLDYHCHQAPMLTLLALDNERVIGCKLGYERKPGHFYSWLGCVDPAYRGQGIASELMRQQHDWCWQNGYHTIRTQTYNKWRDMLVLNIRAGFDIVGTLQGKRGLTIVLEKKLV